LLAWDAKAAGDEDEEDGTVFSESGRVETRHLNVLDSALEPSARSRPLAPDIGSSSAAAGQRK
jgi:hypothetical protein